jgi:hypothetical protein
MAPKDRYDPLPSIAEIPGWLLRKLSPRGRRLLAAAAALTTLALAAGLATAIPAIDEGKEERAAREERESRRIQAQRAAQLRAELRLLRGRGTPARGTGAEAVAARRALAAELAAAVERDARSRVASGEFESPVRDAHCERYPRGARGEDPATDLSSRTGRYSCLAVTGELPDTSVNNPGRIGYPYRARVNFPSGRFTYCKVSGKPAEGSLRRHFPVTVPRACGGGP